jgi:hypothetical protein
MRETLERHDERRVAGVQQMPSRSRPQRRFAALMATVLLILTIAACGSDELTGSWRFEEEQAGRQLVIAKRGERYHMAFVGAGRSAGWIALERHGEELVATLPFRGLREPQTVDAVRFTLHLDSDRKRLVVREEYLGEDETAFDLRLVKVSDNTDGPPWPE